MFITHVNTLEIDKDDFKSFSSSKSLTGSVQVRSECYTEKLKRNEVLKEKDVLPINRS